MHCHSHPCEVLVVGGGHAGIEAALASARMGLETTLLTLDRNSVGRMSCNPAIGGLAKGHLVREIDALGGEMGLAADETGIQFKMLNRSKGRAVWSPRAQIDKKHYEQRMRSALASCPNLRIIEGEAKKLSVQGDRVSAVVLDDGSLLPVRSVVLTCGTFLNGLIHVGRRKIRAGRMGEEASDGMTESLKALGLQVGRLKTGTPPRLARNTVDFDRLVPLFGDDDPRPFSFRTLEFYPPDVPCHLTHTTPASHEIIREHLHESPIYAGEIEGVGPRYCPSIEDKVVRFAERESHHLFLEPEWVGSPQVYTNGFSTSLPEETQLAAIRTVPGLERVEFVRPGYAIEYDFILTSQLAPSLESKEIRGLFLSGQINGTSGYEEAAAQGLLAGINAALFCRNEPPVVLLRNEAYIGVLIDDLVTKETLEPYRMFTSRAEYRLLLRHSNADRRLASTGLRLGLISPEDYESLQNKIELTDAIVSKIEEVSISPAAANPVLLDLAEPTILEPQPAASLLRRPVFTLPLLEACGLALPALSDLSPIHRSEVMDEAETIVKYRSYVERAAQLVALLAKNEHTSLPISTDFQSLRALSSEARDKLSRIRPATLGQAGRISGVSPADVAVLAVHLLARS